jgi:hypothetical protein
MPGKEPALSPLELRKRLLIAESEINRIQLQQEWATMTEGLGSLADRAKTISAYASVLTAFVAGLAALRRRQAPVAEAKGSWVRSLLKSLRVATSIWLALRRGRHNGHRSAEKHKENPDPRTP